MDTKELLLRSEHLANKATSTFGVLIYYLDEAGGHEELAEVARQGYDAASKILTDLTLERDPEYFEKLKKYFTEINERFSSDT